MKAFSTQQIRGVLFFCAFCVYAFAGLPTPDHPGVIELAIALLLVLAVGMADVFAVLRVDLKMPVWQAAGALLLIYGLTVPLITGVVRDYQMSQILRDIFPFLFLLLPVLASRLYLGHPAMFRLVLSGVLAIGVCFAVRAVFDLHNAVLAQFIPVQDEAELAYFANAPTVLFSGLFLAGAAGQQFIEKFTFKRFVLFLGAGVLAALVLLPVALTAQRASLAYAGLYVLVLLGLAFYRAPYRALIIMGCLGALVFLFYETISALTETLAQKTALVGFNARLEELDAVWAEIATSPLSLIFGTGWGGSFESPAVADIRVNYTHGLLSSALLKTGLAGLALTVLYLSGLVEMLLRLLKANPVLVLALAGPIAIDVFLYASFKSLDFGLILLLITACALAREGVAKPALL